jgi:hypothetical protein
MSTQAGGKYNKIKGPPRRIGAALRNTTYEIVASINIPPEFRGGFVTPRTQ